MSASRVAGLAAALLLLTTACAGEDEPPAASPTTASAGASATPSEAVVAWAGDVCSGADQVRAAVIGVGAAVPVDLGGGQPASEQARAGIRQAVDTVKQEAAALGADLQALPADAGADVTQARDELSTVETQAQSKLDALSVAASQVAAATTPDAVKAALPGLRSALTEAGTAVAQFASELRQVLSTSNPAVRSAFSAAPSCQQIPTS